MYWMIIIDTSVVLSLNNGPQIPVDNGTRIYSYHTNMLTVMFVPICILFKSEPQMAQFSTYFVIRLKLFLTNFY